MIIIITNKGKAGGHIIVLVAVYKTLNVSFNASSKPIHVLCRSRIQFIYGVEFT